MQTYRFKKLDVWKKSIEFVAFIYKLTEDFPKAEQFGLTDQLRRAAISISLNIAEGSGAGSDTEFIRFLRFSQRSCYEIVAAIEIAKNLGFISVATYDKTNQDLDSISAMLTGLIKSIKSSRLKTND